MLLIQVPQRSEGQRLKAAQREQGKQPEQNGVHRHPRNPDGGVRQGLGAAFRPWSIQNKWRILTAAAELNQCGAGKGHRELERGQRSRRNNPRWKKSGGFPGSIQLCCTVCRCPGRVMRSSRCCLTEIPSQTCSRGIRSGATPVES